MAPDGGAGSSRESFYAILTRAVRDLAEHGYDSTERLAYWVQQLRWAANRTLIPEGVLDSTLRQTLGQAYKTMVDNGALLRRHPGVSRYTLERVAPHMRAELERRIMASAQLIKLNREDAIQKTVQRFSGWASSVPPGGSEAVEKNTVKTDIRKSLAQLPFIERRVIIDQSHKFTSELHNILATNANAIAATWFSHFRQAGYDYRVDHKDRHGLVYAIRGNWAIGKGLMKVGPAGYTDQITEPGEEVYCRCLYTYIYNLRDLPPDMVTELGRSELERVRAAIRGMK